MTLTQGDLEALAWASAALSEPSHQDYDAALVQRLAAMSAVRHRMLDYDIDQNVAPKNVQSVDREENNLLYPETREEIAWGIRSIVHKRIYVELDSSCGELVQITQSGKIVIDLPDQEVK